MNLPENESCSIKQFAHEIKVNSATGPEIQMSTSLNNGWNVKIHQERVRKRGEAKPEKLPTLTKELKTMTKVINFFKHSKDFLTWEQYAEANDVAKEGTARDSVRRRFYDATSQLVALGLLDRSLERKADKGYLWTGTTNPTIFVRVSRSMKACQLLFKTCHIMQYVRSFKRQIVADVLEALPEPGHDPRKRRLGTVITLFIALGWVKTVGKTVLSVTEHFPMFNSFGHEDDEMTHHFDIKLEDRFDLLSKADIEKAQTCIESYNGVLRFAKKRPSSERSLAQALRNDILERIRVAELKEARAKEEKIIEDEKNRLNFDYFGESPQIFEEED